MAEQQHNIWFHRNSQYSLAQFSEDLASKIIWGPSQTLAVWVLDQDTGSEWKLRRDEHMQQMIKDRWDERQAILVVDVVSNDSMKGKYSSDASKGRCVSGVTNGTNAMQRLLMLKDVVIPTVPRKQHLLNSHQQLIGAL